MDKNKNSKKKPVIVRNEKANGMTEYVITKSPSKTLFGKIVIGFLAFAMVGVLIFGLVFAICQL
jgi:hypothetical protein